jgi:uncharacterized protein (TIGR02588 family)
MTRGAQTTADSQSRKLSGPEPQTGSQDNEIRTLAEWITLIVSTAILAGAFIVITYLYVVGDGDPIMIRTEAQLDQIRLSEDAYYVPIRVFNDGDTTAGDVQIQAELTTGEETEASDFSILALSGNDSETGVVTFSRDPREGELTVRVASYIE